MKCSWVFINRINLNRINPRKCEESARAEVLAPNYGKVGYCYKHLGMMVTSAAKYVDTQFSNMNGDKIEAI